MDELRVIRQGNGSYRVEIGGKRVSCRGLDIRMRVDEVPTIVVDLNALPDMEIEGVIDLSDRNLMRMIERRLGDKDFCDKVWKMIAER